MGKQSQMIAMFNRARQQAQAKVDRDETAIAMRAQMIWAFSMLQCGLSPKTVNKVRDFSNKVTAEKFIDMREDGVAEQWLRNQLESEGIHFNDIPKQASFDF